MKRYGEESATKNKDVQEKRKATYVKKYGATGAFNSSIVSEKIKRTMLKKYGVTSPAHCPELVEKRQKSLYEHYEVTNPSYSPEILAKINEVKHKNNSFHTSSNEEIIKDLLLEKFPDTIYHYNEERYPFNCDFYIPTLDLFIEYQGYWSHGFKPFEGTKEDL